MPVWFVHGKPAPERGGAPGAMTNPSLQLEAGMTIDPSAISHQPSLIQSVPIDSPS